MTADHILDCADQCLTKARNQAADRQPLYRNGVLDMLHGALDWLRQLPDGLTAEQQTRADKIRRGVSKVNADLTPIAAGRKR